MAKFRENRRISYVMKMSCKVHAFPLSLILLSMYPPRESLLVVNRRSLYLWEVLSQDINSLKEVLICRYSVVRNYKIKI